VSQLDSNQADRPDLYDDHPLMLAYALQLVNAIPPSVLWVVGDTWIRCDRGEYFIDADERVDYKRVRQLLIESGGNAYQWTVS
jgi:hypothetical protein